MEFGVDKCAILVLKRGKINESEGMVLQNGRVLNRLCEEVIILGNAYGNEGESSNRVY